MLPKAAIYFGKDGKSFSGHIPNLTKFFFPNFPDVPPRNLQIPSMKICVHATFGMTIMNSLSLMQGAILHTANSFIYISPFLLFQHMPNVQMLKAYNTGYLTR